MKPHEVLKGFTALQWEAAYPDCSDEASIRELKKQNLLQALQVKRELLAAAEAAEAEAARRLSARRRLGADSDGDVHTPPTQRVPGPGVRPDARAAPPSAAAAAPAHAAPAVPETEPASDDSDPIVTTAGPKHAALTSQGLDVSTGLDKRRRVGAASGSGSIAHLLNSTRPTGDAVAPVAQQVTQDGWQRKKEPAARRAAGAGAGGKPSMPQQRSLKGMQSRKQRERDAAAAAARKGQRTQEAARAAEAAGKQPVLPQEAERLQKRKQQPEEHQMLLEDSDTDAEEEEDPILASPTQLPPGGLLALSRPRAVLESPTEAVKRPRLGRIEDLEVVPASDSLPEEGATPAVAGGGGSGAVAVPDTGAPGGAQDWDLGDLMAPRTTPSAAQDGALKRLPPPTDVAAALQRARSRRAPLPPPPRFDVDSIPETPEAFQNISDSEEDLLRGIPATYDPLLESGVGGGGSGGGGGGGIPGMIFRSGGGGGGGDEVTPAAALRGARPSSEVAEGRRSRLGGGAGGGGARRRPSSRFAAIMAADAIPETEVEPMTVARPIPAIATAAGAGGTSTRRAAAPQSVLPTLRGVSPALRLAGSLPASFSMRLRFPQPPGATPLLEGAAVGDGSAPPPAAVLAPPDSLLRPETTVRALPLAGTGQPAALRLHLPLPVLATALSDDGRHLAVLLGTDVTWEPTEVVVFSINLDKNNESVEGAQGEDKEMQQGDGADAAAPKTGENDSLIPAAARVVASIPVQRSRHAFGMPITPSSLALCANLRGDPVLLLSALFELVEGPLTSGCPTVHVVVCGDDVSALGVETDDPLFALTLTGPRTVVAAGYGALGALTLEFNPEWKSYTWGRHLPPPPGAGLPPTLAAASAASGAALDDVCTLVRCVEGRVDDNSAVKSEGAVLLGLTAMGLAGSWDSAGRKGLAAGGSETWALRAAVPLGSVDGVLGVNSESPCFAALLQPRDGNGMTAVALGALAPGAGLSLGAPLPLDDYVTALAALRPGGPVLLGCSDGGVRVWAPGTGACSAPLAACVDAVTAFSAAPAAGVVAVASIKGDVTVMSAGELEAAVGSSSDAPAAAAAAGGGNAGEGAPAS